VTSHLGVFTSALVDGELRHEQREQVLAHLAHCAPCRHQVDAERRFKTDLRALPPAPVPVALADRLLLLSREAEPGEPTPTYGLAGRLLSPGSSPSPFRLSPHVLASRSVQRSRSGRPPSAGRPAHAAPVGRPRAVGGHRGAAGPGTRGLGRRPGLRRSAVGGALLAMGLGGTLALGGPPSRGPSAPVNPTSPAFVVDYTSSTPSAPFSDPDIMVASLITRR